MNTLEIVITATLDLIFFIGVVVIGNALYDWIKERIMKKKK